MDETSDDIGNDCFVLIFEKEKEEKSNIVHGYDNRYCGGSMNKAQEVVSK